MKTDKVFVTKSKIDGQGVFAAKVFRKGEVVLHWDTSHILLEEGYQKLSEKDKGYVAFLGSRYVSMQEPERYVNHSCEANTDAENFADVATRDIQKGEEITSDYSKDMPPGLEMICNCGNKNCQRIIK